MQNSGRKRNGHVRSGLATLLDSVRRDQRTHAGRVLMLTAIAQFMSTSCVTWAPDDANGSGESGLDTGEVEVKRAALTADDLDPTKPFRNSVSRATIPFGSTLPDAPVGLPDVEPDGAASYRIPIEVPDGIAGMQPVLGIDYQGRRGPGLLGPGWNITGLSAVVRCRRSVAQDGNDSLATHESGVPRLLADNAFCLDGVRMIYKAGTGGAPMLTGAEYYSETGPPTKLVVEAFDNTSGPLNLAQPVSFRAYFPDGRIGYYGTTSASRIEAGNRRYAFYVERIEDRFANSIRFSYTRAASSVPTDTMRVVEPMPDKITYTGQGATGGDHELAFNYNTASRSRVRYIENLSIETKTVLASIAISSKYASFDTAGTPVNGVIRFYTFQYDTSAGTNFNVLKQIQRCTAAQNSSGTWVPDLCSAPTRITWSSNTTLAYERIPLDSVTDIIPANAQNYARITVADVNNDGRDDIIYKVAASSTCAKWVYRLSSGRSFGAPVTLPTSFTCSSSSNVGDKFLSDLYPVQLDGRGPIDYVIPFQTTTGFFGYGGALSTLTSPSALTLNNFDFDALATDQGVAAPTRTEPTVGFGEFSPMRTSVLRPNIASGAANGTWFSYDLGLNSSSAPSIVGSRSVGQYPRNWPPVFMDLNGDGVDELITPDSRASLVATGTPTTVATNLPMLRSGNTVLGRFWFMDVNGDGLKDVAYISTSDTSPGSILRVRLNKGDFTFGGDVINNLPNGHNIGVSGIRSGIDTGVRVADVNLDGLDDMLLVDNGAALSSGTLSNGTFVARRPVVKALISRGDGFFDTASPVQVGGTTSIPLADPATGFDGVPAPLQGYRLTQALDADGDGLTDIVQTEGGRLRLYLRSGAAPEMVTTIVEGNARTITYTLAAATETSRFSQTMVCLQTAWPRVCMARGMWLVTDLAITGSVPRNLSYTYRDAFADRGGRGFEGFSFRTIDDTQRNRHTELQYGDNRLLDTSTTPAKYFYSSTETETQFLRLGGGKLRRINRQRGFDNLSIVDKRLILNGRTTQIDVTECTESTNFACAAGTSRQLTFTMLSSTYDQYGHLLVDETDTTVPGKPSLAVRRTTTTYDVPDTVNWLINKPIHIKNESISPEGEQAQRDTDLTTDGIKLLTRTTPGVDDVDYKQERFGYDARGRLTNLVEATADGQEDFTARQSRIQWDGPGGIYPSGTDISPTANAFMNLEQVWRHPAYGHVIQRVDANSVMQRQTFDSSGRILSATDTRSTTPVSFTYGFLDGGARWQVTTTSGSEREINDLDVLGRVVNHAWTTTTNTIANEARTYDVLGRLATVKTSFPDGNYEMSYGFDVLDRPTSSCTKVSRTLDGAGAPVAPAFECTNSTYDGLFATTSTPQGITVETERDQAGRLLARTRRGNDPGTGTAQSEATLFDYGPFDQVKFVYAATGTIGFTYDPKRRLRTMSRYPNVTTYDYDSFDNLVGERHSKDPSISGTSPVVQNTYARDLVGRPLSTNTGTFTWDTAANGKWRLASSRSADGVNTTHTYDANSQPASDTWQIGTESFAFSKTYDAKGRLDTLTYPQAGTFGRLRVKYNYNQFTGLADSIVDVGTSKVLWQAVARNAVGQLRDESMNGGLVKRTTQYYEGALQPYSVSFQSGTTTALTEQIQYHPGGNLRSRKTAVGAAVTTEDLVFDGLDRIWKWNPDTADANKLVTYQYSATGELSNRTVADETVSFLPSLIQGTSTTPFVSRLASTGAHAAGTNGNYDADALGRITSTPAGALTYTDQDLPRRFASTTGATTDYVYDAFRGGVKKTLSGGGEEIALAGLFRRVKQGTSTTYEHSLLVEGQIVGTIEHRSTGGAYANVEFYNRNQVGTVSAVAANTSVVARAGTRDPFGNLVSGTPYLPGDTAGVGGGGFHGFQQQRHDLRAGLIDMNGRYYNARIGRFMSDDPVIADGTDGRSYSAKTFVLNNPARLTDPTGYDSCGGDMQGQCKEGKDHGPLLVPGPYPSSWQNTKYYGRTFKNWAKNTGSDFGDWVDDTTGTIGHWFNKTFNPYYSEPRGPAVPSAPGTPVAGSGNATTVVRGTGSPHTATESTTGMPSTGNGTYLGPPGGLWGDGANVNLGDGFEIVDTSTTWQVFGEAALSPVMGPEFMFGKGSSLGVRSAERAAEATRGTTAAEQAGPKLLSAIPRRVTNAANHIFGPKSLAKHKLDGVLSAFNGDATAAFYSLENAAQGLANRGVISGVFETTVDIAGSNVTVRGAVIDGVARIATAFIP